MKILITTDGGELCYRLAEHLGARHRIHLVGDTGQLAAPPGIETDVVDLCADGLDDLMAGTRAVVHASNLGVSAADPARERALMLQATLGTYRLCTAARRANVDRIIVLSSLRVYDSVPHRYMVDEMWRPRPEPDAEVLAPYLAAECAREFAREGGINGIGLRFLPIGRDTECNTPLGYALHAVDRALAMEFHEAGYRWHTYHIAPGRRFLMRDAVRQLGFDKQEAASCRQ